MRTDAEMKCDVCGCVTGHLTIAKPPEHPKDECQQCYWTRTLNVDGIKAERDAAVAEAWRLVAIETRTDDLSRTVAAMGKVLHECVEAFADLGIDATLPVLHARAILSHPDVTAERGRWRSAANFQGLEEIRSETSRQLNAALDERDAAIASLTIQRDAAEEGATAAVQMRNDALARAHAAEALARERTNERDYYGKELDKATGMVEMHVDDAEAARLLWRQSEAACAQMHAQRDEALSILRDLVTLQDSPSDRYKIDESTKSVNVEVGDLTRLKVGQYVALIDRARKLVDSP